MWRTFGILALVIGVTLLGWWAYNQFWPTPEFQANYRNLWQLGLPLTLVVVGWRWLATKPTPPRFLFPDFVFARILDRVDPLERGRKYDRPLQAVLAGRNLGEVSGGGVELSDVGEIEWVGLDIYLADLGDALQLTRLKLRELGAPPGSVLEYQKDGREFLLPISEA